VLSERLRGLETDDHFDLGRLLDRKIGWLSALEDLIDIAAQRGHVAGNAGERDPRKLIPPLHGALLKNEQDVHLFERLAFLSRRKV